MHLELKAPGFILRSPRMWRVAGAAAFNIAGLFIVCGLIGRAALTAMAAAGAIGKQSDPATLAQMYPTLPTWWIPEGPIGYVTAALIAVGGAWIAVAARKAMKSYSF
jgi:hypothetical protein